MREALVAMQTFAEATRRQYVENLELFHTPSGAFSDPLSKARPYAAQQFAAAQSYKDKGKDCFLMLAHLEGADVSFLETESLVWLGNDAAVFDITVRSKAARGDDRMLAVAQIHGERAVARAIFLRCLLGGYIRALDTDLFQRAMSKEQGVREAAQALVKQSVQEFEASMNLFFRTAAFQREIAAFAQTMEFPLFPIAVGRDAAEGKDIFNGVALTKELAQEMREAFERQKIERAKK
ncbi:MAG: hypothetical protein QM759_10880 [Terricaulis sp.]